jgi:membrane-associated protease RseP (regulator of RpoE activity)
MEILMNNKPAILAFVFAFLIASCTSGYKEFYTPLQGINSDVIAARRASPPPEIPKLERTTPANQDSILAAFAKRGYVMIGSSFFNSGRQESENAAIKQAAIVKADLVLVINPQYTGSVTTVIPLTTPTTTTSQTKSTGNIYGSNGYATINGTSTTTTNGSQTTYVPITQQRVDYGAIYFIKIPFTFGLFVRNLNDSERKELQSNQGVVVLTVVDETPAFFADILPNDIILSINENLTSTEERFSSLVSNNKGKKIEVAILRNGKKIVKSVVLNT